MVNLNKIYHFSRFQRGPTFSRGVQLFPGGGSNCLFPIETHITCDFPGGASRPPVPPSGSALDVHVKALIVNVNKCLKPFFLEQHINIVNRVMLQSFWFI